MKAREADSGDLGDSTETLDWKLERPVEVPETGETLKTRKTCGDSKHFRDQGDQ